MMNDDYMNSEKLDHVIFVESLYNQNAYFIWNWIVCDATGYTTWSFT